MPKKFKTIKPFPFDEVKFYPQEMFLPITDRVVPYIYDYYCISTYGRVWHKYLGKFISPGINGAGYLFFMASTEYGPKPVQIHRAVMITFRYIDHPELFEVNHEDGNKLNPYIGNLSWSTHKENVDHAYRTGLQKVGEENVHSTITNNQAIQICDLLQNNNYTNKEIANIVGCTENIVSDIKNKESWSSISENYTFNSRAGRLFTESMIRNLCIYFENNNIGNLSINDHCRNALRFCGYDDSENFVDSVRKIYTRRYYTNISCDYKF